MIDSLCIQKVISFSIYAVETIQFRPMPHRKKDH